MNKSPSGHLNIVLVGLGHTHLILAKSIAQIHKAGARLILIDPSGFWYSGLATGVLSGMYPAALDHIDISDSFIRQGGRVIRAALTALDRSAKTITLDNGQMISYDLVSFNIGSRVPLETIPGAEQHATPIKPISNLPQLRCRLVEAFSRTQADTSAQIKITVIGAGISGCEIAANLCALAQKHKAAVQIILVTKADRILPRQPLAASSKLARYLVGRGVKILTNRTVTRIESAEIHTDSYPPIASDFTLVAAGLRAPKITQSLDLPLADDGSILVSEFLHSPADPAVFAAGDCAAFAPRPLKKVGVYAVRQAPVLKQNLIAAVRDKPLKKFKPQSKTLLILNLGNGSGLALWGPFAILSRLMMKAKDVIDRRFLKKFSTR